MTLVQFFSILRARWRVMALVLGLAVAGTAVINLLLPMSYTATAAVLVDVKSPDPIAGIIFPGMNAPGYMATQVDVIQSDRVSEKVVRDMRLQESSQMRDQWRQATKGEGNFENWVADLLRRSLDVKPSRDSNVIAINYKAPEPRYATALANAYAQAYIDVSLELRVDPARQYGKFFDERARQLREKVEQARARLTALQRSKGIVGSDERLDVENARLNELSSQLVSLQAAEAETAGREAQSRSSGDRLQEVISNPLISNLKIDLSRQEAKLEELRQRLGESNPAITELQANIAETRSRIEKETSRVGGSTIVANSINRSRISQLQASLESQRIKVLRLKASRDDLAVLAADVDSAQRAYDGRDRAGQPDRAGEPHDADQSLRAQSGDAAHSALVAAHDAQHAAGALRRHLAGGGNGDADGTLRSPCPLGGRAGAGPRNTAAGRPRQEADRRLFGRKQALAAKSPKERSEPGTALPALPAAPLLAQQGPAAATLGDRPAGATEPDEVVRDMALGEIFRETRQLDVAQIESILAYQREHGVLFGEAAVALKLVEGGDVLWALSRQFHYPYALEGRKQFHPELITATTPFSTLSETFRSIRSQLIRRFEQDDSRRALAVVSADAGDGKTFVAANLAIAFSQLGRRTLLIDADMRSPRLHKVFGIDNSRGLSSILAGRLSARTLSPVTDLPSLFVLPVGVSPPNPLELLESPAFGLLIEELLGKFEHVIIDSPAAESGADAGVIATRSGAFVSVARQGRTAMDSMIELVQSLRDTSTMSMGFVLNEH